MSGAAKPKSMPWRDWFLDRLGWTEFSHDKELSKGWKYCGLSYTSVIGRTHAWCGMSLATGLIEAGYAIPKGSAGARNWDKYGTPIDFKKDGIPMGAIVTLKHNKGNRHVTTANRNHKPGEDVVECLGGNQQNSVNVTKYSLKPGKDTLIAVRWPIK